MDAVKNLGRNVLTIWDEEPLELGDFKDAENKFFVRVSDKVEDAAIEAEFGEVSYITAGIAGEKAFITKPVKESLYEDACGKFDIISGIRVDF